MLRRRFLFALGVVPLGLSCAMSVGDETQAQDAWPGPRTPVSYVTGRPPAVGSVLHLSDTEWKRRLTREQYEVLRGAGTERAFSCPLTQEHRRGTFFCAGCGAPLFRSDQKFDSRTGWPSFTQPLPGRVASTRDDSLGMERTEVHCARCGGHLGHSFDDGPPPTGTRFCINGVATEFHADDSAASAHETELAMFAMGCFWGAEQRFWTTPGVVSTAVGYAGGTTQNPTYEEVCSGSTGHAEVVRVTFDKERISYRDLLRVFWENHDPTQGMRQGDDLGTQYRSVIFALSPEQRSSATASRDAYQRALTARGFGHITTEIAAAAPFYFAEEYHQRYLAKNPGGYCGHGGTGVTCPAGLF